MIVCNPFNENADFSISCSCDPVSNVTDIIDVNDRDELNGSQEKENEKYDLHKVSIEDRIQDRVPPQRILNILKQCSRIPLRTILLRIKPPETRCMANTQLASPRPRVSFWLCIPIRVATV
jgi:hypothetical protein